MYNKKSMIKQCVGITSATVLMTMAVTASNGHAAKDNQSNITSSQSLNKSDEVRQITRTIKIDDPYKGMQTVKQTVTFKKVANQWQALTPSFWSSFFVPNYDDFEPDVFQVRAQPVTANDQGETITITYHQYKVPERQRLIEFYQTFYGYDDNFKFTSEAWKSKPVKVGQWYDFPPAPKGYEYCQPEVLPKRLKLYRTDQEPFRLLIQPIQEITDDKHDGQLEDKERPVKNPDENKISTETQTSLISHNDGGTQTEGNRDQEQQTISPESKDKNTQTDQVGKDSGSQTTEPETNTQGNQTAGMKTKDQDTQTIEPISKDGGTQTDSNTEDQVTQTELTAHNDAQTQTEKSKDQGQQTDLPENKDEGVQTEETSKDSASQTDEYETSSNGSQTDEIVTKDQSTQTVESINKDDGSQTDMNSVDQATQTGLISHNDAQTQTEESADQEQQTDSLESKDENIQTDQVGKDSGSQTTEPETNTQSNQTAETKTKNQDTQTIKTENEEESTQTASNTEDQVTQTEFISYNDGETQTEGSKDQGQQTDFPESKDSGVQTEETSKDSANQTDEYETSSNGSQTADIITDDRATQTIMPVNKENGSQTDSNGVDQSIQTELTLNDRSTQTDGVLNHHKQIQPAENEIDNLPRLEGSQIEEDIQDNEPIMTTPEKHFNHRNSEMDDISIQRLLDRDSISLKELSNKKKGNTKNKEGKMKLPQTGNQTDNKTTLGGLIIIGLVTFLTMLSWKHQEKKGKKAKKDLHF